MSKKTEIRAVEMVREIRDKQAELLAGKSNKELLEFFARAGETLRKQTPKSSKSQPA
jgi:hypothetical protein